MKRNIYIGVSLCASWAWGVSLIVTLSVLEDRGIVPFWIWATMNTLAIPIFGYIIVKLPYLGKLVRNPLLKSFMILIQLLSIMVNMQAVFEAGKMANIADNIATLIAVLTGLVFVGLTFKDALKRSMFTDQFQWGIALVGLVILISMGLANGETKPLPMGTNRDDIRWAVYAWVLLFAGPFVDLQGWQRARLAIREKKYSAFKWSGVFFFIYMLFVFIFAHFDRTDRMGWLIFIIAFMVATSTIDSNAAALQEIGKKGFWLGMIAVIGWPWLKELGILTLWTLVGTLRAVVVIIMFSIAIHVRIKKKGEYGEETIYR